jgi:hypothetical protein
LFSFTYPPWLFSVILNLADLRQWPTQVLEVEPTLQLGVSL